MNPRLVMILLTVRAMSSVGGKVLVMPYGAYKATADLSLPSIRLVIDHGRSEYIIFCRYHVLL